MSPDGSSGAVEPMTQEGRPACSLPLPDAELKAGNCNWTKGLQAMSEWVWSGNLNPEVFPNNLGKFFLQIPAIFEQQLNFSTTLIFDEPSFKNGVQISGMLPRTTRELAISLIAQRRRCWYSMTHHAVLGKLTAAKHGWDDATYAAKWGGLTEHQGRPEPYSRCERAALAFAEAFATDPKAYTDEQYRELREALAEENRARYSAESRWLDEMAAARQAGARGWLEGLDAAARDKQSAQAAREAAAQALGDDANQRLVNAQVVELAFVCLQFVALTDVFTSLNIPDEDFLPDVLKAVVPASVLARINDLNRLGGEALDALVPPAVDLPLSDVLAGRVTVAMVSLEGTRVPLTPYEVDPSQGFRDKGLTLGGASVGVYGWAFGAHFPGSLVYALMHHPELARYEPPYSLPVLFNEDEWRNGVQTGGFITRRLKEVVFQKIYRILRCRYGIEHHTMFLLNSFLQEHGGGPFRPPWMSDDDARRATETALSRANHVLLHAHVHADAPEGVFTPLEAAAMSWVEAVMTRPHHAHLEEPALRHALDAENRREIAAALRRLDTSLDDGSAEPALRRLINHQVAELAMNVGHMDGLGRVLTILRLEAEAPVRAFDRRDDGTVVPTGYYQDRPGLQQILMALGLSTEAATVNELILNPKLTERIRTRIGPDQPPWHVTAAEAAATSQF